jgi:hypothetical protein
MWLNHRLITRVPFLVVAALLIARPVVAQAPPAAKLALSKLPENAQSDLVENPVTFSLVQLSGVEESLKAVDAALKKAGYQSKVSSSKAEQYDKGNELMDRKGGGPMGWKEFYGTTAEKYFYHPVDPNTTYHNPVPISQRPPQFDYIYRANTQQSQKAKDEVAALGDKIDKLLERKRQLESQQVRLWARVSAALIAQRELIDRPLYSYHLKVADGANGPAPINSQRLVAVESSAQFLRVIARAVASFDDSANDAQAGVFLSLKENSEKARKEMMLALAAVTEPEVVKEVQPISDLAKRLTAVASSAVESKRSASEADKAGDDQLKLASRGLLQAAIIDLPYKVASLDDGIVKLASDWKLIPVPDKPLPEIIVKQVAAAANPADAPRPVASRTQAVSTPRSVSPNGTGAIDAMKRKVTLKAPYPLSYPGAPTDRLSVQYAVMELLKQANVPTRYDFNKSQANVGELARRWVYPNVIDKPCDTALQEVLSPLALTLDLEDGKLVLKRK